MRNNDNPALLIFVLTIACSAPVDAQQNTRSRPTFDQVLKREDANKDGEISKKEFRGPARLFDRLDRNGDGKLTKQEFEPSRGQGNASPRNGGDQPADIEVRRDVVFGTGGGRDLTMHIVLPKEKAKTPAPVYVWIHGGGWMGGDKNGGVRQVTPLVRRGFVGATIEYRLTGEAPFPAQIEDCKCAIRYLRAHAKTYNIDPDRIAVGGSSAGGHLAALVGTSGGVQDLEGDGGWGDQSSTVQAVVDLYGPTDFATFVTAKGYEHHNAADSPESRLLGGGDVLPQKDKIRRVNPITYVDGDDPPFLIIHGSADRTVPLNQSQAMHAALEAAKVASELTIIEGAGHGGPQFAAPDIQKSKLDFLSQLLKKSERPAASDSVKRGEKANRQPTDGEQARRVPQVPDDVQLVPDIAYRDGNPAWKLDLVKPRDAAATPRPAIVFVHGGGWRSGDKRRGYFLNGAVEFAQQGYVCVTVNYRLTGEAPFPACVEDVKCAVRWLRAHAAEHGVDRERIGAYGNSAGAHLVSMLGLTDASDDLEGDGPWREYSSSVQAVCASATPTDFLNWGRRGQSFRGESKLLAGPADTLEKRKLLASPMSHVSEDAPPFLLVHGTADRTVPFSQGASFAKALEAAGADDVTFMEFDGAGHGVFQQHYEETGAAMKKFFKRTLALESR